MNKFEGTDDGAVVVHRDVQVEDVFHGQGGPDPEPPQEDHHDAQGKGVQGELDRRPGQLEKATRRMFDKRHLIRDIEFFILLLSTFITRNLEK